MAGLVPAIYAYLSAAANADRMGKQDAEQSDGLR